MKLLKIAIWTTAIIFCQSAWSLTIEEAKQQGRVGETLSGYIAAVRQDKETLDFVQTINQARAQKYQEIATKNQMKLDEVAKLAGAKLVNRAEPGEYVKGINGLWVKK